jgi:hypothetical protein
MSNVLEKKPARSGRPPWVRLSLVSLVISLLFGPYRIVLCRRAPVGWEVSYLTDPDFRVIYCLQETAEHWARAHPGAIITPLYKAWRLYERTTPGSALHFRR